MKLFTDKYYHKEMFKQTMKKIWRPIHGVKFHDLDQSLILVEFADLQDKYHVLREGPWSLDKKLLLMREFDGR